MASIDLQISAGSDDGDTNYYDHEYCAFALTDSIYIGKYAEAIAMVCYLRWLNITIPQGATITAAHISFYGRGSLSEGTVCNADIDGDDEDNCATYTTCPNLWARPRTTASVAWNGISSWASAAWYDSPDIASVIQEIINRGGWSSGNAIGIFVDGHRSDVDAKRYFRVQEYFTPGLGAKLHIEYTIVGHFRRW